MTKFNSPERLRTIVRLAASMTEISFAKAWLLDDPQGKWEMRALKLLETVQQSPSYNDMTSIDINEGIATALTFLAVESIYRSTQN